MLLRICVIAITSFQREKRPHLNITVHELPFHPVPRERQMIRALARGTDQRFPPAVGILHPTRRAPRGHMGCEGLENSKQPRRNETRTARRIVASARIQSPVLLLLTSFRYCSASRCVIFLNCGCRILRGKRTLNVGTPPNPPVLARAARSNA